MSSTTKKPKISEENAEFVDSLATTTDLYKSLDHYIRESKKNTSRAKNRLAEEISQIGEIFIDEIDIKNQEIQSKKEEQIKEIFKKSGDRYGSKEKLLSLPIEEVQSIYVKSTESRKSWFNKIMDFLMDW